MKLTKLLSALLLCLSLIGCGAAPASSWSADSVSSAAPAGVLESDLVSGDDIPEYSGVDVIVLDGNIPGFDPDDLSADVYEAYSGLDSLGRCGAACALVGPESFPTEDRGDISDIEPSGWLQASYEGIDGGVLYNRSHLYMRALGGDDDPRNLITGTRYMNATLMLEYEMQVLDFVESTGTRVLYRVTPVYVGDELVARGVQMEALSVEDDGESLCFNVFCYNVQPGIEIDYATGESWLAEDSEQESSTNTTTAEDASYVLNTNSMKFHDPDCESASKISEKNREYFNGTREEALALGYEPCGICKP